MKLLLLTVSVFYLIGCGLKSGEPFEEGETYKITHAANNNENVFIYLVYPSLPEKEKNSYDKYKVNPGECLSIPEYQFSALTVKVGEGGYFNDDNKTLCGDSDENKCQAGNYEIVNLEPGWFKDDKYVLQTVTEEGTDTTEDGIHMAHEENSAEAAKNNEEVVEEDSCADIVEWMTIKNPNLRLKLLMSFLGQLLKATADSG